MFEELDQVDWASMTHAYGPATDLPDLLRHLVSHDPDEREFALDGLYGAVHHQGDIYDCTIACIPFLLEAVADPNVPDRGEILGLLASIGGADTRSLDDRQGEENDPEATERFHYARRAHEVILAKHNMFLALLIDPDPAVRRKVPHLLAACWEQATRIVPALQGRLTSETDRESCIQLIEAIGALAGRAAKGQTTLVDWEASSTWLVDRMLGDDDPSVRLCALVHIARLVPARLPSNIVATVLDILEAPDPSASTEEPRSAQATSDSTDAASTDAPTTHVGMLRQLSAMVSDGRYAPWAGDLLPQLHSALGDRVQERLELVMALLRAPGWEWREDGIRSAGNLIHGWRGSYAELVTLLGEQLADPTSRLCYFAILALTHVQLGHLAVPAADAFACYLDMVDRISGPDRDLRQPSGWIEVYSHGPSRIGPVLKTLAALGDSRAVPALDWILERDQLPANTGYVLASMGHNAARFISKISQWLRTLPVVQGRDETHMGLLFALGRFGPAAAPAISKLVGLLGNERLAGSAARALGLIGPQAAVAVPVLKDLLGQSNAANAIATAQALYRINGDAEAALPTLKRHLAPQSKNKSQAADCTAELGAAAAPVVPQLRALLTDPLPVVRVRAAGALWAVAADLGESLPVLLADWEDCPNVRLDAARCIVQMGSAAQAALPFLQSELARVRRHTHSPSGSGSQDIVDDEALLEACAVGVTQITGEMLGLDVERHCFPPTPSPASLGYRPL